MRDKYTNPKEAICLFLYSAPQNIGHVQERMYPDNKTRNTRVSGWIKELLKDGWIKEIPNIKDRRVRYYQTTSNFFYDHIINKLKKENVKLTSEEKKD
ncbi:unnamed protein product [marine sediment metagenome]|uniref:Uncharacterized protein n=1 Tax=marine sediment metagenome TaxID=412755 RepID=X1C1T9_9ZZZZ